MARNPGTVPLPTTPGPTDEEADVAAWTAILRTMAQMSTLDGQLRAMHTKEDDLRTRLMAQREKHPVPYRAIFDALPIELQDLVPDP